MVSKDRPWRKIIHRKTTTEEVASLSRSVYSWRSTEVHTLTLECGHKQKRRGCRYSVPKHKVICKDCEAGKAPVEVTVEPGVDVDVPSMPRDPVAAALITNAVRDARERAKETPLHEQVADRRAIEIAKVEKAHAQDQ